ncbi:hypothetical protein B0H16DRAFT_1732687 [Mycena metata]|uniref:Uncharacterized protein n=1 Tax=Mycena metata TaxID=1033252 RepID=A0AAD7I147_9AGAR|nr:hypothetical protein B0H16DRAFT_1732687 [Mycena metata]
MWSITTAEQHIIESQFLHTLVLETPSHSRPSLPSAIQQLAGRLSFPQLRYLKLGGRHHDHGTGPTGSTCCDSFFAGAPRLEDMEWNTDICTKDGFKHFLLAVPSTVRCLRILPCQSTDVRFLLDEILLAINSSCQGLQELEIEQCLSASDDVLVDFIKSRMVAGALSDLIIRFTRHRALESLPDLQPFLEAGLRIKLTSPPPPAYSPLPCSPWYGLEDGLHGWTFP